MMLDSYATKIRVFLNRQLMPEKLKDREWKGEKVKRSKQVIQQTARSEWRPTSSHIHMGNTASRMTRIQPDLKYDSFRNINCCPRHV